MKKLAVAVAGLAALVLVPSSTAGSISPVASFSLSADGTQVVQNLSPGVYLVTVSGVYDYDTDDVQPDTAADAECSTDTPLWDGVVDQVANDDFGLGTPPLYPSPLSEWQRYRFGVQVQGGEDLVAGGAAVAPVDFFTDNPLDDVLDVYINDFAQAWVPADPTPVDGPGVQVGCDTTTHTYTTPLVVLSGPTLFRIHDIYYPDNAGSLDVTIDKVL